ncbi:hypothetical protein [Phyllobacterium sophorae]|jgi:hypothetical protein|uniref:Uncharacterized protein n=1 Tax=Phyllobacterium sophorae TaxID=1520277 RepID=A0A2P7BET3_9HYPH|nr:hypothetical protein [Phyllobacterium sophorae]PSH64994.1 hypothetical protein CU103_08075 [Phyllobacterium sophorae]
MTILNGAIIVVLISIAAGTAIPVWGFAIFAFFVSIGWGGGVFYAGGSSLITATIYSIGVLVLMEISYLAGVFLSGLWRRARKAPTNGRVADPAQATSKHRRS